MTELICSVT